MGKGATSITNSLYRINDKIAQASVKTPDAETPGEPVKSTSPAETPVPRKTASVERIIEFNRMYHDLEIRVESMDSEYQSEIKVLESRLKELNDSAEQMIQFRDRLEKIVLPDENEPDPDLYLSKQLRALEMMRLETIRLTKKTEASKGNISASSVERNCGVNLMDIPSGDIMKKGFAFFFPLALSLFFCTILLALAFILAWKVVI